MPESSEFQTGPTHPKNDGQYNPISADELAAKPSKYQTGPVHEQNDGIYNPMTGEDLAQQSSEFQTGPQYEGIFAQPEMTHLTAPQYGDNQLIWMNSDYNNIEDSDYVSLGIGEESLFLSQEFPVLNTYQLFPSVDDTSEPVVNLFESYIYDPRTSRPHFQQYITKHGYSGTKLTKINFTGDGDSGIGGLFNTDGMPGLKYNLQWATINTPTLDEIITQGNWGYGHGTMANAALQRFNLAQEGELVRYYQDGNIHNDNSSWYAGGQQPGIMAPNDFVPFESHDSITRTVELDGGHIKANELKDTGGWERLYNADGSSKGVGYHYPNVDQTKLKYGWGNSGLRDDEPYVIRNIGDGELGKAERSWPYRAGKDDVKRITKFLGSKEGGMFFLKQNILGWQGGRDRPNSPFRDNYLPFGTIFATLAMGVTPGAGGLPIDIQRNEVQDWFPSMFGHGYAKSGHMESSYLEKKGSVMYDKEFIKNAENKVPSFVNKDEDKGFKLNNVNNAIRRGDKMTMHPGYLPKTARKAVEKEAHGMPMWFQDMRDHKTIYLRAYLEGLNENFSPSWNTHDYPGRSEPVYTYQKAERDISFTLKVMPGNIMEERMIWKKLNWLSSLCYPEYAQDVLDYTAKLRMKPPFCKLRIGEYIGNSSNNGQLGFIKSLSYTVPENSTWQTLPGMRKPKHITAAITFQCINYGIPDLHTNFYGSN